MGGICRYLLQQSVQRWFPSAIPWGTFWVNITGCFAIGIVYALADRSNLLSTEMRLFLATGICGGFTTFSSFAYENVALLLERDYYSPLLYVFLSIVVGFAAVFAGLFITRILLRL